MKTWWVIAGLFAVSMLGGPRAVAAEDYESGFGFGFSLSDEWLVLTRSEVMANAGAFLGEAGSSELEFIPLGMRRVVYERVIAGELEVLYRRDTEMGSFVDNINVLRQVADLPRTRDQLDRICEILPGEFSRVFGRPISMDECMMRERLGRRALYLQFDGVLEGTKTLQYQLQRGLNATLILTATVAKENLPRMMGEFEAMIASIRLH